MEGSARAATVTAMSQLDPNNNKSDAEVDVSQMVYCGTYEMREEDSASDNINGTIVVGNSNRKKINASPGDDIDFLVEYEGVREKFTSGLHKSGDTMTVPLHVRESLGLSPGDTINFWISNPESDHDSSLKREGEQTTIRSTVQYVYPETGFRYHLKEQGSSSTLCGHLLDNLNHRVDDGAPDQLSIFDACLDCKVSSGEDLTDNERKDWILDHIEDENTWETVKSAILKSRNR